VTDKFKLELEQKLQNLVNVFNFCLQQFQSWNLIRGGFTPENPADFTPLELILARYAAAPLLSLG